MERVEQRKGRRGARAGQMSRDRVVIIALAIVFLSAANAEARRVTKSLGSAGAELLLCDGMTPNRTEEEEEEEGAGQIEKALFAAAAPSRVVGPANLRLDT